jgi:epoxyqueuosine reductase
MDAGILTRNLKGEARRLGFDHCRILPIAHAPHADFYDAWVAAARPGEMQYLTRHLDKRRDPALLADHKHGPFNTIIVLGVNYHQFDLPPNYRDDPARGIIASYAWGDDYHEIIRPLLYELDAYIRRHTGRFTHGKCLVDTGPVLERDWAARAGIGFTGKNCCTIHPKEGSWLFLATILVPETLVYDREILPPSAPDPTAVLAGLRDDDDFGSVVIPLTSLPSDGGADENGDEIGDEIGIQHEANGTCGRCTRCLDACPTMAFDGPFHLNPQRCISYWTIETQSPIPRELRPLFGNRIFGCDICQEVCPWNQRLQERTPLMEGLLAHADHVAPYLEEGIDGPTPYWMEEELFAERFRNSPVLRATRAGMARNVAVALGNSRHSDAIVLLGFLLLDPSPLVRGHAAWGLGQVLSVGRRRDQEMITAFLNGAEYEESDPWAKEEIRLAFSA